MSEKSLCSENLLRKKENDVEMNKYMLDPYKSI